MVERRHPLFLIKKHSIFDRHEYNSDCFKHFVDFFSENNVFTRGIQFVIGLVWTMIYF